ncbi:MAG: hypothetical protein P4L95_02220 [Rouxiella aceris]|uniref:hypothetical protein n=1 Tax=Rouxiella aceris TaxID=2703884 RepID=UPI00284DE14A|nr:hypothetical protein [Rouxiella aceris]MDR3430716.1 hypothetical protein [Rouxiella aceris]
MMYGMLALECCARKYPLEVLRSDAGYYIGTSENAQPFSRESVEYWLTHDKAEDALHEGTWSQLKLDDGY